MLLVADQPDLIYALSPNRETHVPTLGGTHTRDRVYYGTLKPKANPSEPSGRYEARLYDTYAL